MTASPRARQNPDGDALPWCVTATDESGCGLVRDGYSYQTCLDRCVQVPTFTTVLRVY
jgi:hypothetical protein